MELTGGKAVLYDAEGNVVCELDKFTVDADNGTHQSDIPMTLPRTPYYTSWKVSNFTTTQAFLYFMRGFTHDIALFDRLSVIYSRTRNRRIRKKIWKRLLKLIDIPTVRSV